MGSSHHEIFDFNFRIPFLEGTASGVLFVLGMISSAVTWILLCVTGWDNCGKAITCAFIGMALVLLLNVLVICFLGYDGFGWGYRLSLVAGGLFTFFILLIAKFAIIPVPEDGHFRAVLICLNILADIFLAIFLMMIPVAIISALIWLVMELFGN